MLLNFENKKYLNIAIELAEKSKSGFFKESQVHSQQDAFMLLLKGVERENLDNLSQKLKIYYPQLNDEQIYEVLQGNFGILNGVDLNILKTIIYNCAMECINEGKTLGTNTIETKSGTKRSTSTWISHCLWESKVAGELAEMVGINSDKVRTLAILHDYGRKYDHSFGHVTRGFEELIDNGWMDESVATLTHSFINGGRCATCDPAEEGFYLDENGEEQWENNEPVDDVSVFLKNYDYCIFDDILNIADLMATSKGIVSPYDRVQDIRKRKKADPRNEGYFLVQFMKKMTEFLNSMGVETEEITISATNNIEVIRDEFIKISQKFYNSYKERKNIYDKYN